LSRQLLGMFRLLRLSSRPAEASAPHASLRRKSLIAGDLNKPQNTGLGHAQRHSKGNVVSQVKTTSATPIATPMPKIDRMLTMPASQATSRNSDSMA
jgi:hypothetical protein